MQIHRSNSIPRKGETGQVSTKVLCFNEKNTFIARYLYPSERWADDHGRIIVDDFVWVYIPLNKLKEAYENGRNKLQGTSL